MSVNMAVPWSVWVYIKGVEKDIIIHCVPQRIPMQCFGTSTKTAIFVMLGESIPIPPIFWEV